MDLDIFSMFLTFVFFSAAVQMFPAAAAESPSDLTCDVTRQPDDSFKYQLSRPPSSLSCQTSWEDQNETALAKDSSFYKERVLNLTNQLIITKHCEDLMHYTSNCLEGFEEASCRVNCSHFLDKDPPPHSVNSTMICFSESLCVEPLYFWIPATCALLLLSAVVCLWRYCKCKRGQSAFQASYVHANGEVELQEVKSV